MTDQWAMDLQNLKINVLKTIFHNKNKSYPKLNLYSI